MSKGLPRSLSRGVPGKKGVYSLNLAIERTSVVITDPGAAAAWGTLAIGQLPQGNLLILGLVSYLKFTKNGAGIVDTFDGDYAIGTAPSTSNIALATNKADLIASTAFASAAAAGVTAMFRAASAAALAGTIFDNTDGSLELNLNILLDDAAVTATAAVFVEGSISVQLGVVGDD